MNPTLLIGFGLLLALAWTAFAWRTEVVRRRAREYDLAVARDEAVGLRGRLVDAAERHAEQAGQLVLATRRLAAARRMNKRLKAELLRRTAPRPSSSAGQLVDSGLPGAVLKAIAEAPVAGVQRQQLVQWAEVQLLAEGWPGDQGAEQRVAQAVARGATGPDDEPDFD